MGPTQWPWRAGCIPDGVSAPADSDDEAGGTRWPFAEGDAIVPGRHVVQRLGGGTEYEAFLAWDERLMSLVVAKCLRPHRVADGDSLRRLRRETEYLMTLRHPVVVRGLDAVLDGPRPHVVMEHLEGPNLASLLRRSGALALQQLIPLALQVVGALHYLHAEAVVHLDVKPRNIIMSAPPRLIDLSVARSLEEASRITGQIGTDAYMAPEQCDPGLAQIGPPADIWGVGATLFHAVAGAVPFPRQSAAADSDDLATRFPQLHASPPALPGDAPPALGALVGDCLRPAPEQRPTAAEVVERLEPLISALPRRPVLRRMRPRLR